MRRFDSFCYAGEEDMLECRLVELEDVDIVHVIVEADVDHQNHSKPYHFLQQRERFAKWSDRIIYVEASGLPGDPDAWSREHAQREWVFAGLERAGASPEDLIFHGDVDEIPTAVAAEYIQPRGIATIEMSMHPFAVDWLHPISWHGTCVTKLKNIKQMAAIRDARLTTPEILPSAGWHLSWVGDEEARARKINSFCHPEIRSTWEPVLEDCFAGGRHVDGYELAPTPEGYDFPRWVAEGHAPASWFRPAVRGVVPDVTPAPIFGRFAS